MMWRGYPQHPDAHPERPWWRAISAMRWQRTDGRISRALDDDEAEVVHEQLARQDTAHPLPPPAPRCGQVWVTPSGAESMVQMVYPNGAGTRTIDLPDHHFFWPPDPARPNSCWGSAPETLTTADWPPPGAVLVAGPGAPWAPMGGDDGR